MTRIQYSLSPFFFALVLTATSAFAPPTFRPFTSSRTTTVAFSTFLTEVRFRPNNDDLSRSHDHKTEVSYLEDTMAPILVGEPQHIFEDTMRILTDNNEIINGKNINKQTVVRDPSMVEFASGEEYQNDVSDDGAASAKEVLSSSSFYPFAAMMHGAAPYIASHTGQTFVFHIPAEIVEDDTSSNLFEDMALAWMLGMKLVIVVGSKDSHDSCDLSSPHACSNTLSVTDAETLRHREEEAGFLRTEVERKLNRCLRLHGGCISTKEAPAPDGNVVSGNLYTAKRFGQVRGKDFEYTGYTSGVHTKNIQRILDSNDVVLLTTVGVSPMGDLVDVNGYHLAAAVASALEAYKVIFMSNEGSVLKKKGERAPIQALPCSFAKAITDYHNVQVHKTGFATFEQAHETLPSGSVELLLHLGWAAWALENGVTRAHIVNPGDGALLEELFTSANGANTCLYRDEEDQETSEGLFEEEEWDAFFSGSASSTQNTKGATVFR